MKSSQVRIGQPQHQKKDWKRARRQSRQLPSLAILALFIGILVLASCSKAPLMPLRVAVNLWPGYETLYLARSLGYYDNTPVKLVDFPSGTEQVRAFRNGSVDAAAISLDQALVLATTHPDIRIISIMDFSEGGDVILSKPGISNLKELKGKRVGVEVGALGAYIITRALEQVNLSTQDVQIVSLGLSEHERAFQDGTVDAVVTFGPARTKLLAAGAKQIFDSSQIPGEIVDVLLVRENMIQEQPETVQSLINGRFRALDYLAKNPQDSAIRVAPRTGVTPQQFLDSLKGLRSPDLQENQKLLGKTDPSLLKTTIRLVDIMLENKLLPQKVDAAPLLDDRWVKAARL